MNELSLGTVALAFACLSFVVGGVFLARRLRVVFGAASVNHFEAAPFDYVEHPAGAPQPQSSAEPPAPAAVLPQQHQAEPSAPAENAPAAAQPQVTISAHLSKAELITLLAVQKDESGAYLYSANKICDLVGGADGPNKALIAELRGTRKPVEPKTHAKGARLERPAEGWAA